MTDETRPVTEFNVTYFGLSALETDALLDLYADHAYKFAERHKHDTPLIGSHSYSTEEVWENDLSEPARRVRAQLLRMAKARDEKTRSHGIALLNIMDGRETHQEPAEEPSSDQTGT